ncbi:MAG: hypothetical protein Kow0092_37300 [Deferrisomatales bacterium]
MRTVAVTVWLCWVAVFAASASWAAGPSYRIGPGDLIEVSVWRDENLTREILVPPDGWISFPLLGDIQAAGRTVSELRDLFRKGLVKYVPDTPVSVFLKVPQSLKAYVIGKVNKPGQFPIGEDTTVLQILAMAGGLNPYAAADKILVLRQEGEGTVKLSFNYDEVKKGQALEQNVVLRRGDVVVVP